MVDSALPLARRPIYPGVGPAVLFVISDVASGSILFMGIANDPVSGG